MTSDLDHPPDIAQLSKNYRRLVLWFGSQLIMSAGSALASLAQDDLLSLALTVPHVVIIAVLGLYSYRIARLLGSSVAMLWAVEMLFPYLNIITRLALSRKSTAVCRANGIRVGLFGPAAA